MESSSIRIIDGGDKPLYEGEFLNGRRNGQGKEHNKYGKLIFEGEYKDGYRTKNGKDYFSQNKICYIF